MSECRLQALIVEFRRHITDNFYNCTVEMFKGIGEMYVSDEHFTKNIDRYGKGLTKFLSDSIEVYCQNQ